MRVGGERPQTPHRFPSDLQAALQPGTFSTGLFTFLRTVGQQFKLDVQVVEGVNSMVKLQCTRSPRISLELLSSRVAVEKALSNTLHADARGDKSRRWADSKTNLECLHKRCLRELQPGRPGGGRRCKEVGPCRPGLGTAACLAAAVLRRS